MSFAEASVRTVASIGLISKAVHQYQHDMNWWLYVPIYGLAALISLYPIYSAPLWRLLSAVSIVGGGIFLFFLSWVMYTTEKAPGYDPSEGKNLLPIAIGLALVTTTRLSNDVVSKPIHYLRTGLFLCLLAACILTISTSAKYFRY